MKYRDQLSVNVDENLRRVSAALAIFARLPVLPQHSVSRVTSSLMRRLNECTASLGIEGLLTESPFANLNAFTSTSGHGNLEGGNTTTSVFELEMDNGSLPNDFLHADFSDMAFPNHNFDFST